MATNDVYTLQLHQLFAGQQIMNTLAFRVKAPTEPALADFQALADDLKTYLTPRQVNTLTWDHWVAQQVRGGSVTYPTGQCKRVGGKRFEAGFTAPVAGLEVGEGLPPQSAWVTTITSDESGRSHRGRLYLSGVPENIHNNGTIAAASVTAYQTIWNNIKTEYFQSGSSLTWEMGIWSFTIASGCKPLKTPPYGLGPVTSGDQANAYTPATGATVRNIVYSQRKRTIGVGR